MQESGFKYNTIEMQEIKKKTKRKGGEATDKQARKAIRLGIETNHYEYHCYHCSLFTTENGASRSQVAVSDPARTFRGTCR